MHLFVRLGHCEVQGDFLPSLVLASLLGFSVYSKTIGICLSNTRILGEKILIFRKDLNGLHPVCQQADEKVEGRGSGRAVSLGETNPGRLGSSSKGLSIQCKYGQSTGRAGGKGGYRVLCLATMVH